MRQDLAASGRVTEHQCTAGVRVGTKNSRGQGLIEGKVLTRDNRACMMDLHLGNPVQPVSGGVKINDALVLSRMLPKHNIIHSVDRANHRGGHCRNCLRGLARIISPIMCSLCAVAYYCSVKCWVVNWSEHRSVCCPVVMHLLKIHETSDGRKGLLTTTNIVPKQVIFIERPTMTLPRGENSVWHLFMLLKKLPQYVQLRIEQGTIGYFPTSKQDQMRSVILAGQKLHEESNALELDEKRGSDLRAMGRTLCQGAEKCLGGAVCHDNKELFFVNSSCVAHSCVPNTLMIIDKQAGEIVAGLMAIRNIGKGEILTRDFIANDTDFGLPSRIERKEIIAQTGLTCRCEACLDPRGHYGPKMKLLKKMFLRYTIVSSRGVGGKPIRKWQEEMKCHIEMFRLRVLVSGGRLEELDGAYQDLTISAHLARDGEQRTKTLLQWEGFLEAVGLFRKMSQISRLQQVLLKWESRFTGHCVPTIYEVHDVVKHGANLKNTYLSRNLILRPLPKPRPAGSINDQGLMTRESVSGSVQPAPFLKVKNV